MDVPTLLGLGLDEHLAEVWLAMAAAPGVGVRELAETVGISEAQVREVLDDLGDRALIRASRQSPGLLVPIAPEAALAQLLRREEEELAAQRLRVEARCARIMRGVTARVAALVASGEAVDAADADSHSDSHPDAAEAAGAPDHDATRRALPIEPIAGADAIRTRFERLVNATTVAADVLVPAVRITACTTMEATRLEARLLHRGVRIRLLYREAIRDDVTTVRHARALLAAGAHVRSSIAVPQRLFVSDRRAALVPLEPAVHGYGAAVVRAPGVVAALLELFDAVWHNASPLDVGRPADTDAGLSDTERSLLHMLAEGASDERAAKKLGVSLRTVRRIMADLMHRLDASSRFEAGIKSAKRGWL